MATYNTDVVDALAVSQVRKSEYRGNVQWIPVEFSDDGTYSADTIVFSDVLPANTELLAIRLETTAIASGELDIGYTSDPDAIIDGATPTSAGVITYPWNGAATVTLGAPVDVSGKQIIGTLTGTMSDDSINGYILIVTDE